MIIKGEFFGEILALVEAAKYILGGVIGSAIT